MSTTITFAGNLTEDPVIAYTRDGTPFVTFRVLVNRQSQNPAGEWVDEEPTPHNVRVFGTAANNVADSFGRGDRAFIHGRMKTESWLDKESGEKRTKDVVEVNDRFGEVGASLKWAAARIERTSRPHAVSSGA